MRFLFVLFSFISSSSFAQWKDYKLGIKGDTLDKIDGKDHKQGKWVHHIDELRGEPGFEEEGEYRENRKEGIWRLYNLQGDLIGLENYKWGNKDGMCSYFNASGELLREEGWRAMNPDKPYDTLEIEDIDHLNEFRTVIVKNDGVAIKHGSWKFYSPSTGMIFRTETYTLGKLEIHKVTRQDSVSLASSKPLAKPKEVQEFEKKNAGKKKIKIRDGEAGN